MGAWPTPTALAISWLSWLTWAASSLTRVTWPDSRASESLRTVSSWVDRSWKPLTRLCAVDRTPSRALADSGDWDSACQLDQNRCMSEDRPLSPGSFMRVLMRSVASLVADHVPSEEFCMRYCTSRNWSRTRV